MSKLGGGKRLRPPRTCIFCGGNKLTGEHLWPEWAGPMFDPVARPGTTATFHSSYPGERPVERVRKRQGHVTGTKIHAVCAPCNNEWMSRLEAAAKPILIALSTSDEVGLDANAQGVLAHWVCLKMMVAEHSNRDQDVFTQEHRTAFMVDGIIPDQFRIWVFKCGTDHWRSAYLRATRRIELVHVSEIANISELPRGRPNAHSIAVGFNDLFVYANFTVVPDLQLELDAGRFGSRLWPPTGGVLQWPPRHRLATALADRIAERIADLKPVGRISM